MKTPPLDIRLGDPKDPDARALLTASHDLMQAMFPAEANHYLSVDDLIGPDVLFYIATLGDKTAGCAALILKDGYAEIKSMYVDPSSRGAKIGSRLLQRLAQDCRTNNRTVLRLETGDKLVAARRLYAEAGFAECGPFGDYKAHKTSIFMEKKL